ncbi:MAG TPA: diaminopimelate decarboxylase, partial [Bacteroidales bacterium]|nr:diaminopimelate decarboxylase [Bacteroidales bacterium]
MTTFKNELIHKFSLTPTPFYYYDLELLDQTLESLKKASDKYGYQVHYALKANANPTILKQIRKHGFGADCVSGNEVSRAAETGFAGDSIVFAGVGKSDEEIKTGLENNIHSFNCESAQELEVIDQIAGAM